MNDWQRTICVASGPSFSPEQAQAITAAQAIGAWRVIVVNDNWRRIPTADILYAGDASWYLSTPDPDRYLPIAGHDPHFLRGASNLEASRFAFAGERWIQADRDYLDRDRRASERIREIEADGVRFVRAVRRNVPLPIGDARIASGNNSGFAAIMLARLFGARTIALVGYDMQRTGGREHWFGRHPKTGKFVLSDGDPTAFRRCFDEAAPYLSGEGIDVFNCSAASALTCFRRASLSEILAMDENGYGQDRVVV